MSNVIRVIVTVSVIAWVGCAWGTETLPAPSVESTDSAPGAGSNSRGASDPTSRDENAHEASTGPAWTPTRPVLTQEPWESAVRMPLRLATLPIAALGAGARGSTQWFENSGLTRHFAGTTLFSSGPPLGLALGAPHLGPSVGMGIALRFEPDLFGHVFTADLAGSTRKYTRTALTLKRGPASLGYEYDWRPQDLFFGYGLSSSDDSVASYAWRQQSVRVQMAYPYRSNDAGPLRSQFRAWVGPREEVIRRGRLDPSFEEVFPELTGFLDRRHEHFVYGAEFATDTRSGTPHWSRGYSAEFRAERFDKAIDAFTIRSANTGAPSFTRLSFHGSTAVSFMRDPRTLRFDVRLVHTGWLGVTSPLLFPDLAGLGADYGLASLDLGRYRDLALAYGSAMYLFPLSKHVELEFHAETGGVYPSLRDARPNDFRESYGFSLRPRSDSRVLAAIGADWSPGIFVIRYELTGDR